MAKSDNLRKAKAAKNDEHYTRISDIIAEIAQHKDYVRQFEGKIVLCNCDDPEWSAFVEFFRKFFHKLKLKKMIATHYNTDGSPSYKLEWSGEKINGDTVNMIKTPLKGNGDFASEECVELLKEADIVVTNPPFSKFRVFSNLLYEYNKQFIIIGSMNAIAYKEFFPRLRDGDAFIGYTNPKEFVQPDGTIKKFGNICWYTNLDLDKSHEPLILTKNYKGNEEKYPKYDNYDAIECNKVANIPKDYFPCWYECPHAKDCPYAKTEGRGEALCETPCNGEIGVPITVLSDFCSDQMEALSLGTGKMAGEFGVQKNYRGRTDLALTRGQPMGDAEKQASKQASKQTLLSLQQDHHQAQKTEDIHVEDISAYRSHTCQDTAQSSSGLSDSCQEVGHLSEAMTDVQSSMSTAEESTPVSSFKGRRKCNGMIGVPITFMAEWCLEQFEICGMGSGPLSKELGTKSYKTLLSGDALKRMEKLRPNLGAVYLLDKDGMPKLPYNRIIIRRRKESINNI